jgi:hypothetical protein
VWSSEEEEGEEGMLRCGRWGGVAKPGWFRVRRCRVVVGAGGSGETWTDRRRLIGRLRCCDPGAGGSGGPGMSGSLARGWGLVAGASVVGWWGSRPVRKVFPRARVWSALVGYKGARREVTSGDDHLVGRPRWAPSGCGSIDRTPAALLGERRLKKCSVQAWIVCLTV